jgi:hypothetical protein
VSVWFRVAGLLRRKDLAIDIIEAEIRSAQQEAFREAAKLVVTGDPLRLPASCTSGRSRRSGPNRSSVPRPLGCPQGPAALVEHGLFDHLVGPPQHRRGNRES